MQVELTSEEMNLILSMFGNANIGLLAANSIAICTVAQGIAAKFQPTVVPANTPEAPNANV